MKTLRLLVTKECNKGCSYCCNKQYDLDNLPIADTFKSYDEIIITGGEPTLFPSQLLHLIYDINMKNPSCKIIVYTTDILLIRSVLKFHKTESLINGITLSIHDRSDLEKFEFYWLDYDDLGESLDLRVNVFSHVIVPFEFMPPWKAKENIKPLINCPIPANEEFKRLRKLWSLKYE